jgi:hypothetical protein
VIRLEQNLKQGYSNARPKTKNISYFSNQIEQEIPSGVALFSR